MYIFACLIVLVWTVAARDKSWETVGDRTFIHCALPQGITDKQAAFMASRPLVTVEKFMCQQCEPVNSHAETKLVEAAEQIARHGGRSRVLAYFPSW